METIYRILKYLKGCRGKGLLYKRHGNHRVEGYTDAHLLIAGLHRAIVHLLMVTLLLGEVKSNLG